MADTHENWDGSFEDAIRCPHCGERDEEHTDYPRSLEHDGDTTEASCSNCGADFQVTICVEYSWATNSLFIGPKLDRARWYALRAELRQQQQEPEGT